MKNSFNKSLALVQLILLAIVIIPGPAAQAYITNGKLAQDLLGQYDDILLPSPQPQYEKGEPNDGYNILSFEGPMELDSVHHRFFLGNGSRVLVYDLNTDNTFPDKIPDNVLGQPDFVSVNSSITQAGLHVVSDIAYDSVNDRLFVSQSVANRVSVFDTASITDGENAVNVLGQSNFTSSAAASTQAGMFNPQGLAYDSTNQRLFVMQQGNHRVTVFDVNAITNGENAVNVLGQSSFTASTASTSQSRFNSPRGIAYDSTNQRLFVSQQSANRVTVFDVSSITNGENAINVLGQSTYTASTSATTQAGLNIPQGIDYDSSKGYLFVTQIGGNRVSVFDVNSITNGENAINVLGQSTFTDSTAATSQSGMNWPFFALSDSANEIVYIGETGNSRALAFDISSISDGENAVDVFGQYDDLGNEVYTKGGPSNGPNKWGFYGASDVAMDTVGHRLFVSDSYNHRVLIYDLNSSNTLDDKVPDHVLGQPNFYSNTEAVTQNGMSYPVNLAYDSVHDRLFVINNSGEDYGRVLVYDTASISDGENAVNVLGQADFTSIVSATTQSGMRNPWGLTYDSVNDRLFVGDDGNTRILVFDTASISDGENAINVLGQPDFTTSSGGVTAAKTFGVSGLAYDFARNYLYAADASNSRILVFDVNSITNGENAIKVLGQTNFTSNSNGLTSVKMDYPEGLSYDQNSQRLFVADEDNQRVLVFDLETINNAESAINVIGQSAFNTRPSATTQSGVNTVSNVFYDSSNDLLYLVDSASTMHGGADNNRIMIFDAEAIPEILVTQSDSSTDVTEGGVTDTFEVSLSKQPASDVVIDLDSSEPSSLSFSDNSLTFTNSNWATPQTVTVTALQDLNIISESPRITLSLNVASSDPEWFEVADYEFTAQITDEEAAGFVITDITNPYDLDEGTTKDFQITLLGPPIFNSEATYNDVVLNIYSTDPATADVSIGSLTFTDTDWDTPQPITVEAFEDVNDIDEALDIIVEVNTAISSDDFFAVNQQSLTLNIIDNDAMHGSACTGNGSNEICASQDLQCPELVNSFGIGTNAPANFQIGDDGSRAIASTNDTSFTPSLNASYFDNDNDSAYDDTSDDFTFTSNTPLTCANGRNTVQLTVSATPFLNGSNQNLVSFGTDGVSGGASADYYAMFSIITSGDTICDTGCTLAEGSIESNNGTKHGEENFFALPNLGNPLHAAGFDVESVLIDNDNSLNTVTLYNNSDGFEGEITIPGLQYNLALPGNPAYSGSFSSTITYTLNS